MHRNNQYYNYDGTVYLFDGSYISDLGYLMIRLYDEEKKIWLNISLGSFEELLLKKPKFSLNLKKNI